MWSWGTAAEGGHSLTLQMVGAGKTQGPEELWKKREQQEAPQARHGPPPRESSLREVFMSMVSAAPGRRATCPSIC